MPRQVNGVMSPLTSNAHLIGHPYAKQKMITSTSFNAEKLPQNW